MTSDLNDSENKSSTLNDKNYLSYYILQYAVTFLIALISFKCIGFIWDFQKLLKRFKNIPGPQRKFFIGNVPKTRAKYYEKFGIPFSVFPLQNLIGFGIIYQKVGLLRIWLIFRPCVVLFKPETVEPLLSSLTAIDKTLEYRFLQDWLGTGLLTSSGLKWKNRRKMLTPTFHFRTLEEFQPVFSEQSQILVDKLANLPDGYCSDIMKPITMCTLDIICETALGTNVSAQTDTESSYVKAIHSLSNIFTHRAMCPWIWNNFLFSITPSGRQWKSDLKVLHDYTQKVIKDRKSTFVSESISSVDDINLGIKSKRRFAFLDLLLQEHFRDSNFTETDIQEEVDTFTFEGHDTTATGIAWCTYMIGLYSDVQDKIHDELTSIFGNETNISITTEHIKKMKYLECVIKESQRLYPSVPIIARELKEDLIISGHIIPATTTCFITVPSLHRNPEVFPDPEKFQPERFLQENSNGRHPYAYIPFSAGPRNCIGQRFALSEEKTVLANVLRNFKLTSLDQRDKIRMLSELVNRPSPSIRVLFQPRLSSS